MAEDHSLHHESEDLDEFKPQEVASMRWQAIEAFNRIPGLSLAAGVLVLVFLEFLKPHLREWLKS